MISILSRFIIILFVFLCSSLSWAEIPIPTDSRIKTYVYSPNDVYLVLVASGFQTSIELEPGEVVKTISAGDSYSWSLTPLNNRLFIKPLEDNIRTNMTLITSSRTYQFDIVSTTDNQYSHDIAYVIRFYYPDKYK